MLSNAKSVRQFRDIIRSMIFVFAPMHKRPIEIEWGLKEGLRQQNASVRVC